MAKHLYLSKLHDDAKPPTVPRAAHWHEADERLLGAVADGIDVNPNAAIHGVSSVPDIWARPLLVQAALRPGGDHPLHDHMVRQWRGLLSLLALRELHKLPVEIVPVSLVGGTFANALETFAPRPFQLQLGQTYSWTDVLMIRYDGVAVGAFSPTTLVYTATGYQHQLKNRQSNWVDADGFLQPPTEQTDLEAMAEWVSAQSVTFERLLDTRIQNEEDNRDVDAINALLSGWLSDLRSELGIQGRATIDAGGVGVADSHEDYAPSWPPLKKYQVYSSLLRPLVHESPKDLDNIWSQSTLFMSTDRYPGQQRGVVVIHPRLLASDTKVWGFRKFSSLGRDPEKALSENFGDPRGWGEIIAGEKLSDYRAIWVRPEVFFLTNTLVRAKGRPYAVAAGEQSNNAGGRFLLPFRASIFDYFSPDDIVEKLRPEFTDLDNNGTVRFSFNLPMRAGGLLKIEKVFRVKSPEQGEGSVRDEVLPVVDLFPRYIKSWRRYFLFYGNADRFTVTPIVFDGTVREPSRRVSELPGGPRERAEVVEMSGEDAFPEALLFDLQEANERTEIGALIVVRKVDDISASLDGGWKVGVDFGTSNTNVFIQHENEEANPLEVDFAEFLRPMTDVDPKVRDRQLQTFFVPNRRERFPTPTMLDLLIPKPGDGRLLLDYFIHFPDSPRWPSRVRYDLKWNAVEPVTAPFLECILFLILLKAADERIQSVSLRVSFPKTFTPKERDNYTAAWTDTYLKLFKEADTAVLMGGQNRLRVYEPCMATEGRAAGEFFASTANVQVEDDRATKQRSICLDVGGGTTDISVWFDNRIVFDTSVRLAGRQIASYLGKYPALREMLLSPDSILALSEAGTNEGLFGARLNYVLRKEDLELPAQLRQASNRPELARFQQLIAFQFGAIAFYTADLVAAADEEGIAAGLKTKIGEAGMGLYWGGNASKLLTWIDYGERRRHGNAEKMLNGLFYMAMKDLGTSSFQEGLKQVQSTRHKSEAAGGLVVMELNDRGELESPHPTVNASMYDTEAEPAAGVAELAGVAAGENIVIDGRDVAHNGLITEKDLFRDGKCLLDRVSSDRLSRFVEQFNIFGDRFGLFGGGMAIQLDTARKLQIQEKTKDFYVSQREKKDGDRVIEPVFIVETKILMDLMKTSR